MASGFLSKGNIYFNVKFKFTSELSLYNRLGQDLIDFAWFDTELIDELFSILWRRYMLLKTHRNDYKFVLAGLVETCDKFLNGRKS